MLRAVVAAAAAALVVPVSAEAALSFAFDRPQARIGQRVHAYQADADGNPAPAWETLDGVTLYLARVDNLSRRVQLGQMGIGEAGVWSIDFRVPKVRPGLYMIAFLCGPCGNTYFGSADLHSAWTRKPGGRALKVRR
ncbi:MAG: hypothetical protein E6G26_03240 [Actinobacteria bacterium]|nr:MAG: hypothetical protein E6G26_03240 [Actinomycetota bacterium]